MQQVENRVGFRALLIPRRRVHMGPASLAQGLRGVVYLGHRAVRHILPFRQIARHSHQAPGVLVRLAGGRILRVHHRHPVDVEGVAVGPRRHGTHRHLPHTTIIFLQICPRVVAGDVASRKFHTGGFRSQHLEGHLSLGTQLNGFKFRRPLTGWQLGVQRAGNQQCPDNQSQNISHLARTPKMTANDTNGIIAHVTRKSNHAGVYGNLISWWHGQPCQTPSQGLLVHSFLRL